MITKDFYAFLESNGGVLNICGIKFVTANNGDIDIYIDGKLYKWIRNANEREMFLSDLTNVECGENDDFIEVFARDYIKNEQNEQVIENNKLSQKVNDLETEIETLKERNKNLENDWKNMRIDQVSFEFLKNFLKDRDIVIHN